MSIPPAPVHVGVVEQAAKATLAKWLWTYIGFAEQWYGYPVRSLPRAHGPFVTATADLHNWPEQRLPFVMLHGGAMAQEPDDRGATYDASWTLTVAAVVGASGLSEEATLGLARAYGAAVQACLSFQPWEDVPDGVTIERRWMDTADDLPVEINRRTMAATRVTFLTVVSDAMRFDELPAVPDPLPDPPDGGYPTYPDTPTAEQINVTVERLEP